MRVPLEVSPRVPYFLDPAKVHPHYHYGYLWFKRKENTETSKHIHNNNQKYIHQERTEIWDELKNYIYQSGLETAVPARPPEHTSSVHERLFLLLTGPGAVTFGAEQRFNTLPGPCARVPILWGADAETQRLATLPLSSASLVSLGSFV